MDRRVEVARRHALALTCLSVHLGASWQDDDEARKAEALMKKVEALLQAKMYEEARAGWNYVVAKYPNTPSAEKARYLAGGNCVVDCVQIVDSGPSENRIDVHILGDSYRYLNADQRSFHGTAKGIAVQLTSGGALREYQRYFNHWRVQLASQEQGTSTDSKKFDTALAVKTGDGGGGYSVDGAKARAVAGHLTNNDGVWLVLVRMGAAWTPAAAGS